MWEDYFDNLDNLPIDDSVLALACQVEEALRVRPVEAMPRQQICLGVTRFIMAPEFTPETIITCLWRASCVDIEIVQARYSVIDPMPPIDLRPPFRWKWAFSPSVLPAPLQRWSRIREAVRQAPSASTLSFGGAFCWHRLWDGRAEMLNCWCNPDERRHPGQCRIIGAYQFLVVAGRLLSLLPRWRWVGHSL